MQLDTSLVGIDLMSDYKHCVIINECEVILHYVAWFGSLQALKNDYVTSTASPY